MSARQGDTGDVFALRLQMQDERLKKIEDVVTGVNGRNGLQERMSAMENAVEEFKTAGANDRADANGIKADLRRATYMTIGSLLAWLLIFMVTTVWKDRTSTQLDEKQTQRIVSSAVTETLKELNKAKE